LHNGRDALIGLQIGPATGRVEDLRDFDDLFEAYHRQVQFFMELIAKKHSIGQQVVAEHCPFLFLSILFEDCVKKGKGLLDGVRYLDGLTETNGFVNVADSFTTIKELVYEKQKYSLKEITQALNANFEGYRDLAQELLSIPKFGNDNDRADEMAIMVHCHVAKAALAWSNKLPYLRRFYVSHVNNHAHVQFGAITAASADGRKAHEPLANGNNPTAGRDVSGTTAMLKSLAKIPADCVAGMVQNMKFSRQMFYKYRQKTKALLTVYFKLGGHRQCLRLSPLKI